MKKIISAALAAILLVSLCAGFAVNASAADPDVEKVQGYLNTAISSISKAIGKTTQQFNEKAVEYAKDAKLISGMINEYKGYVEDGDCTAEEAQQEVYDQLYNSLWASAKSCLGKVPTTSQRNAIESATNTLVNSLFKMVNIATGSMINSSDSDSGGMVLAYIVIAVETIVIAAGLVYFGKLRKKGVIPDAKDSDE